MEFKREKYSPSSFARIRGPNKTDHSSIKKIMF